MEQHRQIEIEMRNSHLLLFPLVDTEFSGPTKSIPTWNHGDLQVLGSTGVTVLRFTS